MLLGRSTNSSCMVAGTATRRSTTQIKRFSDESREYDIDKYLTRFDWGLSGSENHYTATNGRPLIDTSTSYVEERRTSDSELMKRCHQKEKCVQDSSSNATGGFNDLEKYKHQVGGHSQLMKPRGTSKLFKPLYQNEFLFYEKLFRQHRRSHHRNSSPTAGGDSSSCTSASSCDPRRKTVDSAELPLKRLRNFTPQYYGATTLANLQLGGSSKMRPARFTEKEDFIVLKDLVYSYKKPCVLDMKMGSRQRSLHANPEKERRQIQKSLETTSSELGFRFCGCQFYDVKSGCLFYKDKYWGRRLTKSHVLQAMLQWFWNGYRYHLELVLPLLSKLRHLRKCVSELRHYRFWSCSLLWMYDGGLNDDIQMRASADIRLIDFANTTFLDDNPSPDLDLLEGLDNLSAFLLHVLPPVSGIIHKAPRTYIGGTQLVHALPSRRCLKRKEEQKHSPRITNNNVDDEESLVVIEVDEETYQTTFEPQASNTSMDCCSLEIWVVGETTSQPWSEIKHASDRDGVSSTTCVSQHKNNPTEEYWYSNNSTPHGFQCCQSSSAMSIMKMKTFSDFAKKAPAAAGEPRWAVSLQSSEISASNRWWTKRWSSSPGYL